MLQCATQHPLLHTFASIAGLSALMVRPRVITLGIGLSTQRTLSRGLPFDVLGMLLPAEQLRRAVGAERVVVLVADRHAVSNGFAPAHVEHCRAQVVALLARVRQALRLKLDIVSAEVMHRDPVYRAVHAEVCRRAGTGEHPYVTLEAADTEYLRRLHGSIVKLGWSLGRSPMPGSVLDERMFDARFREWVGRPVGFVYARAGRTLDPARLHAPPYVVVDPARRLLLAPDEDIEGKLRAFSDGAPTHVRRAVTRHLQRIAAAYGRVVQPLRGPLESRLTLMLAHIFGHERCYDLVAGASA